jgi:signal transduction histidine kinase
MTVDAPIGDNAAFVLVVGPDGALIDRVIDGIGLPVGDTLAELVASSATGKLQRFLAMVEEQRAVAGWELPFRTAAGPVLVAQCGACRVDGAITVVGQGSTADLFDVYDEMMRINNEQANELRKALRHIARLERGRRHGNEEFDELTRLTNELSSLQRDLSRNNRRLRQLDQSKNQLLGMVAHDLRNPLGVSVQFSRMLSRADLGPRERKLAERLEANSRYMLSLVEDLLDLSAVESGEVKLEREEGWVGPALRDAVEQVQLLADDKGTVLTLDEVVDGRWSVDRRRVQQLLVNLLSNAIKYSPAGSEVRVGARGADGRVRVEVIDQGPGIPEAERDQLFRPFGRTSARTTGGEQSTGLGLAIAKKVVEAHGGRIGVDSVVGEGSTFWFELPLA